MTDEDAKKIANEVVLALEKRGVVRDESDVIYSRMGQTLKGYYSAKSDTEITDVLEKLKSEKYFEILPLYYGEGATIEELADKFSVDVSTIKRQKKRLCLMFNRYDSKEHR